MSKGGGTEGVDFGALRAVEGLLRLTFGCRACPQHPHPEYSWVAQSP